MNRFKLWLCRKFGVIPPCDHVEVVLNDEGGVFARENLCTVGGVHPVGDWGPPEPHPVSKFSSIKIQRRPVAAVMYCPKCGFIGLTRGFDQRDILQSAGGILRNDLTPKRGI